MVYNNWGEKSCIPSLLCLHWVLGNLSNSLKGFWGGGYFCKRGNLCVKGRGNNFLCNTGMVNIIYRIFLGEKEENKSGFKHNEFRTLWISHSVVLVDILNRKREFQSGYNVYIPNLVSFSDNGQKPSKLTTSILFLSFFHVLSWSLLNMDASTCTNYWHFANHVQISFKLVRWSSAERNTFLNHW